MELRTHLGSNGRVVIPASARRALGIEPGDELILVVEDGEIRLCTARQAARKAQELVRQYSQPGGSLADSLVAERREEAARE
ncbi:MAG: AbrB/MazE/SpoVT family DNA-binding domain-containing protein [Thermoanaerobaculales bacterium]|jgi:AbrB family looped-hinge helix DNA binding protein|nr:AbrB/MazE/SpoVT family DNA-binding domain-containing protein [Thermoanaerobaculales bacterium]